MAEGLERRKAETRQQKLPKAKLLPLPVANVAAYAATTLPPLKAKKLLPKKLP